MKEYIMKHDQETSVMEQAQIIEQTIGAVELSDEDLKVVAGGGPGNPFPYSLNIDCRI
jgi:hypothetical protein